MLVSLPGYLAVTAFTEGQVSAIVSGYIMGVFAAQRFATALGAWILAASAVLMAPEATYGPAFAATASGKAKTATMLIKLLLDIGAFQRTVNIGEVVDFAGTTQIVHRVVSRIATDYDFFDHSYNSHTWQISFRTKGSRKCGD